MAGRATLSTEKSTASVKLAVSSTTSAIRCFPVIPGGCSGESMSAVRELFVVMTCLPEVDLFDRISALETVNHARSCLALARTGAVFEESR